MLYVSSRVSGLAQRGKLRGLVAKKNDQEKLGGEGDFYYFIRGPIYFPSCGISTINHSPIPP